MNRCDISGEFVKCKGHTSITPCEFWEGWTGKSKKCRYTEQLNTCSCLAAIRAAIEAEGVKINCPDCGEEKTILCDCWKGGDR
jgi:hypothetical protein